MEFPMPHPAARILLWLMLAVFLQWAAPLLMLLTAFVLLVSGARARQHWWRLFLRTRLLLLALFLVFAYGAPGESPGGLVWLPSHEGLAEAMLHVLRLVVFLGALSWLFATLSQRDLLGGLWFLLQPCRYLGLPVDKSVVRLFLVLEYLEKLPRQSWRQWLLLPETPAGSERVRFCLPLWRARDAGLLFIAALSFVLLLMGFPA
jgi:energy-coupling factor transporter transmembrane protein EcfT